MEKEPEKSVEATWKEKIKDHWKVLILLIAAIVVLCVVAVIVVIWHINTSPIGAYGTATFNEWTLDWIFGFSLVLILWELLFVGLPAGLFFGVGGYLWWTRLSADDKTWFKSEGKAADKKSHKTRNVGGGGGLVMFLAYCIYMGIQGSYYTTFGSYPFSYWVFAYMQMMLWLLIIVGIPCAIGGLAYLRKWLNKP